MRSREEVAVVLALAAEGLNHREVARRTGVPRGTNPALREGDERSPATPVVVLTAFTGAELEQAALAAGATAHLAKDANLEELRATLAAAVEALADRPDLGC